MSKFSNGIASELQRLQRERAAKLQRVMDAVNAEYDALQDKVLRNAGLLQKKEQKQTASTATGEDTKQQTEAKGDAATILAKLPMPLACSTLANMFSKLPPQIELSRAQLLLIWDHYDKDGNGSLDASESKTLLQHLFTAMGDEARLKQLLDYDELSAAQQVRARRKVALIRKALTVAPSTLDNIATEFNRTLSKSQENTVTRAQFVNNFRLACRECLMKQRVSSDSESEAE
jgi:hypothetical protein